MLGCFRVKRISIFIILFLLWVGSFCVWGQSILLQNVVLDSDTHHLSISVAMEFVGIQQLESILKQRGYPVIMDAHIAIKKVRPLFWNKTMFHTEVRYSIVYNPLTNKFVLANPVNRKILVSGSFGEVIKRMKTFRIKVGLWNNGGKGKGDTYLLELQFVLKKDVPWWMEKLLFFKSFNISSPQSYSITFRY